MVIMSSLLQHLLLAEEASTAASIQGLTCGGALGIWGGRRSRLPIML